ncbi:MAG: Gfo/Idh/MocA family oxidoreductase [Planctomycetes bacterium]|nr:Gfo/Idh/MocA family oxidoreductase [Planctomycetota bacterium]
MGARGRQLIDRLREVPNVRVVALCDVDQQILGREVQRFATWQQTVKTYRDMRDVLDSPDIDAVFVATPNHWHALATIWACQAGKDVYVEKPASHSIWEGRQMVAAARKHKRIVQVGTQYRSSDISQQAVEFLRSGQLGKIRYARAIVYRRRESIGKVAGPQTVPASVDYDLWLGPAPETPLMRSVFHYDWHWFWATGNGEIGNNGVHYLDRCRWLLGQDGLPPRAMSLGGRFAFNDDGQTANTQIALLDYEPAPIICEVRGLPERQGSNKMDSLRAVTTGIIVQCERGYYKSGGGSSAVYDNDDQKIKEFTDRRDPAERESAHQANFIEAVRSRNTGDLNAEIRDGHYSAALCHMANVSYRLGRESKPEALIEATKASPEWSDAFERFGDHLAANGIDLAKTPATLGPWVTMDSDSEQFAGDFAEEANAISHRKYRAPFVVPDLV